MKIDEVGYVELLNVYGKTLTPVKAEIAEMYFGCDVSLSEIAEIKNITRQSVADAVKSVKAELDDMEEKIGMLAEIKRIKEFSKTLNPDDEKRLIEILEK